MGMCETKFQSRHDEFCQPNFVTISEDEGTQTYAKIQQMLKATLE
jgi:hypothetical protein